MTQTAPQDNQTAETRASAGVAITIPVHIRLQAIMQFVVADTLRRLRLLLVLLTAAALTLIVAHFIGPDGQPFLQWGILLGLSVVAMVLLVQSAARRNVKIARSKQAITAYRLDSNGLTVLRGDQEQAIEWCDVLRIRFVKKHMVFYATRHRAYLLPMQDWYSLSYVYQQRAESILTQAMGRSMPAIPAQPTD